MIVCPKTSAKFLAAPKLHTEAAEIAIRPDWAISVLGATKGGTPPRQDTKDELRESVLELKAELAELKRASKFSGLSGKRDGASSPQNSVSFASRTADGNPICHRCGKASYVARYCEAEKVNDKKKERFRHRPDGGRDDPQEGRKEIQRDDRKDDRKDGCRGDEGREKRNHRRGNSRETRENDQMNVGMVSTDEDETEEFAVLLIDSSRLITEVVTCQGMNIRAVIDTGAVVSVASPELQRKLQAKRSEWDGPSVVMEKRASGRVIVLKMKGIELLLRNDFLSQFRKLQINYDAERPELFLGSLAGGVVEELESSSNPRIVTKTGRTLPPMEIVPVEIEPANLGEATRMIEPSENLSRVKGVTTGKVLVTADLLLDRVIIVNLANHQTCLREGTVLGQMEVLDSSVITIEEADQPRRASGESSTVLLTSEGMASHLPAVDAESLIDVLEEFSTCFALRDGELGMCRKAEHRINTGTAEPVHQPPYKSAWKERAIVQEQVDEMEKKVPGDAVWVGLSPGTFQRMMDLVLAGLRWSICLVYLDDIIINASGVKEHLSRVRQVLTAFQSAGLKIKLVKCQFGAIEIKALGHVISGLGIRPDPDKINTVVNFPIPSSFNKSSEKLKCALAQAAILAYPDFSRPFEIHPNTCDYSLGAVLLQRVDNLERPLPYASRLLSKCESNFSSSQPQSLRLLADSQKSHMDTPHRRLRDLTSAKEVVAYQGVIFKSEGEAAFSDSEWVVATDHTFDHLKTMMKTLREWLEVKVDTMANFYGSPRDKFKLALQQHVKGRSLNELGKLRRCNQRFSDLKAAVNLQSARRKRGLVDGSGKVLSWIFGMSTQEDLEHVHGRLDKLSTETTYSARLGDQERNLEARPKKEGAAREMETHWIAITIVEDAFRQVESALAWLDEALNNFSVGIATMSVGRLPVTLFPPLQVQAVLKEIKAVLPPGCLPYPIGNATLGSQFEPLPPCLAVASDSQAFVELTVSDSSRCVTSTTSICPISREVNRKHREPSCAMALFLKDEVRSRAQCKTRLSPWRGQQTVYLGQRRWWYSTTQETTITFNCPHERGRTNAVVKKEAFDVFEVPMSCSAHTDDWIFQLGNVVQLLPEPAEEETPSSLEKKGANANKPLLSRRTKFQGRISLMGEHLRVIEEEEKARVAMEVDVTVGLRYPYELVIAIVGLLLGFAASLVFSWRRYHLSLVSVTQRIVELEGRLAIEKCTNPAGQTSTAEKHQRHEPNDETTTSTSSESAPEPSAVAAETAQRLWIDNATCVESRRQAEEELDYVTTAFTDQLVALIRMKKLRKATEKLKEILDLDPANRHPPLFWPSDTTYTHKVQHTRLVESGTGTLMRNWENEKSFRLLDNDRQLDFHLTLQQPCIPTQPHCTNQTTSFKIIGQSKLILVTAAIMEKSPPITVELAAIMEKNPSVTASYASAAVLDFLDSSATHAAVPWKTPDFLLTTAPPRIQSDYGSSDSAPSIDAPTPPLRTDTVQSTEERLIDVPTPDLARPDPNLPDPTEFIPVTTSVPDTIEETLGKPTPRQETDKFTPPTSTSSPIALPTMSCHHTPHPTPVSDPPCPTSVKTPSNRKVSFTPVLPVYGAGASKPSPVQPSTFFETYEKELTRLLEAGVDTKAAVSTARTLAQEEQNQPTATTDILQGTTNPYPTSTLQGVTSLPVPQWGYNRPPTNPLASSGQPSQSIAHPGFIASTPVNPPSSGQQNPSLAKHTAALHPTPRDLKYQLSLIRHVVFKPPTLIASCSTKPTTINPAIFEASLPDVAETIKGELRKLLLENQSIFAFQTRDLGNTGLVKHVIDTQWQGLIRQRPYRASPRLREVAKKIIDELLANDIIRPSLSPWAAPIVLVKKKTGDERLCIDYRKLNAIMKKDSFPLPRIDDVLDLLQGQKCFSTLDLASGYWQIEMDEQSKEKTAFIVENNLYEWNRLVFDLTNAPGTFQRLMNLVFRKEIGKTCLVYLDDIIIFSKTPLEHISKLRKIFYLLEEANIKVKLSKCRFLETSVQYLGHVISADGVAPDTAKIESLVNYRKPLTVKEMQSFLGLASFYRRFIKGFSTVAHPFIHQAKGKLQDRIKWGPAEEKSFEFLGKCLMTDHVLAYPDFTKEFLIHTVASDYGLGAFCPNYTTEKTNQSPTPDEPFVIISDHRPLQWLSTFKYETGRLGRWSIMLANLKYSIKFRPDRVNENADFLSRIPVNSVQTAPKEDDAILREPKKDSLLIHQNLIEMYEPSDEENHDPKKSQQNASRSSTPTKQLVLPKEFFEYVGDPVGKNSSQHNAKRHYLSYDPKDELGHEKL
ncbi:Uncharacterized protein APZ42_015662 [Daphnia magna]|uniref:RNA-directed DNA polymerase n=1 Tax=Daphnia magna TaxID=35525 RepID=A0A162NT56_9CRUS|nr:Uncharacterized protein APZ42_015662 [Daphnia magna]